MGLGEHTLWARAPDTPRREAPSPAPANNTDPPPLRRAPPATQGGPSMDLDPGALETRALGLTPHSTATAWLGTSPPLGGWTAARLSSGVSDRPPPRLAPLTRGSIPARHLSQTASLASGACDELLRLLPGSPRANKVYSSPRAHPATVTSRPRGTRLGHPALEGGRRGEPSGGKGPPV